MSRKERAPIRYVHPDPKFIEADLDLRKKLTKFINGIMFSGQKSVAEKCVYDAFDLIEQRRKEDPLKVFQKALDNVRPRVEVKSRRVGGSTYQVPMEVDYRRSIALAMRWLKAFSRKRPEYTFVERLAAELMEASEGRGSSVKKKEDTHKMAEANKAFAHYRW
ncbi:MAG: 30S ribosomal protein S7 [Myxococcota bacterium]